MLRAIVALLLCTTSTLAQPSLLMHLGLSAPLGDFPLPSPKDYWPVGFTAGASGELMLTKWLQVRPGFTLDLYPFDRFHQETYAGDWVAVSSSGEPFEQLHMDLMLRLLTPNDTSGMRLFLVFGGTYLIQRTGKVTIGWRDQSGRLFSTESGAYYRRTTLYTFGFGMAFQISSRISIEPSIVWQGNNHYWDFGLVNLNAVYAFTPW